MSSPFLPQFRRIAFHPGTERSCAVMNTAVVVVSACSHTSYVSLNTAGAEVGCAVTAKALPASPECRSDRSLTKITSGTIDLT